MKVVFRADASLQMGTGHVMRCLTLADALRVRGAECRFLCREHPGNLIGFIRDKGFPVEALPRGEAVPADAGPQTAHADWLGVGQERDAADCSPILAALNPDWLIVDHYALDSRWELALKPHCGRLMVVDDLADRAHACDLLLDQTFGRDAADYRALVPAGCMLLCGSQYALLRPEFAALRPASLQRRAEPRLRRLLITMGGVDKDNATGKLLEGLKSCALPADCRIVVVMGTTAPALADVRQRAEDMPWPTDVRVGVGDMARLMADSDLVIGAAGATSWERCCLGLPTVMLVLADNQRKVAGELAGAGAVCLLSDPARIVEELPPLLGDLLARPARLGSMSRRAAAIVDGRGAERVFDHLESLT